MAKAKTRSSSDRAAEVRKVLALLHQWGIHTLGQFAALPKEEVSVRLGSEAVRMWERANGTATRLLKFVQPPESFAETFEFESEIETSEPLLFILQRFLQQLTVRLGALYLVAQELKLRITFSDKTSYEHRFQIPEPSNHEEVLFRMLQTHLENFTSAAPITAVALEAEPTKPAQQQFGLFETALRDPGQLSETLARLTGLFGTERVGTPVLRDTHRPDAFRLEAFSWQLPETPVAPETSPKIALRRFRPAPDATVWRDGGKLAHFRCREAQGEVREQAGPYKLSGEWWEEKSSWARAEWDLQLEDGALCRGHEEANAWQLDGIYD